MEDNSEPKPISDILFTFDEVEVYYLSDYHTNEAVQRYADAF